MTQQLKKLSALILAITFILPVSSAVAAGDGLVPVITVGSVSGKPGETVEIPLTVENNPGFSAFMIGFEYDPSALTVESASVDQSVGGQASFRTKLVFVRYDDFIGDGVIATVRVKITDNAKGGASYRIGVTAEPGDISNFDEKDVSFAFEPGSVSVEKVDASEVFDDVRKTDWFCQFVTYAYNERLMKGVAPALFSPDEAMSRAMLVTVLWRVEGSKPAGRTPFADLIDDWYLDAVGWAYENGIVMGTSSDTFSPDDPLTREQIAAIMFRYAQFKGDDVSSRGDVSGFPDHELVSDYAIESIEYAVGTGLISGDFGKGGTLILNPLGRATRAQVATILTRYLSK